MPKRKDVKGLTDEQRKAIAQHERMHLALFSRTSSMSQQKVEMEMRKIDAFERGALTSLSVAEPLYHGSPSGQYVLTRDGLEVKRGTEDEIWKYIHRHHCYSVDHAIRHEGYAIVPIDEYTDMVVDKAIQELYKNKP